MSKAKFDAARELIQEKHYDAARAVLRTIDHPQATSWLAKLQQIAPEDNPFEGVVAATPPKLRSSPLMPIALGGLSIAVVILIGAVIVLIGNSRNAPPPVPTAAALAAAPATASATNTSAPTAAATSTSAPTATSTVAPTSTTVPTRTFTATKVPTAQPTSNQSGYEPAPGGKWMIKIDTSSFDDSKTVTLVLDADKEIKGWLDAETPSLVLRCKEKQMDVYVFTGMQANVESGNLDHATVRIRFDKDPAQSFNTGEATSGKGLFFDDPIPLIKDMLKHNTMVFGFTPFNASPVETVFDLRGLPESIKPLQDACKWK